jgi:hypothetical protein
MNAGASPAFALVRVPRGEAKPTDDTFLEALQKDREKLSLPALNGHAELVTAGPYAILVDGTELDEYVVWEK